jgi:hypothetical protein
MDVTIEYYLKMAATETRPWKKEKYIKIIQNEIASYRSTAWLNKGKSVASLCNSYANQLDHQLSKIMKEMK